MNSIYSKPSIGSLRTACCNFNEVSIYRNISDVHRAISYCSLVLQKCSKAY